MVLFQDGEYQHAAEKPLRISGEQSKVVVSINGVTHFLLPVISYGREL